METEQVKEVAKRLRPIIKGKTADDVIFLCIGTDRSTGDSLGPLVGTQLRKKGYQVIGDIDDPTHALNVQERWEHARKTGKYVIAIDACLGNANRVGYITAKPEPLSPGAGAGKDLGRVGHAGIYGVVNVSGYMEHIVLQNTRLSLVLKMVDIITQAITQTLKEPKAYISTYQEVAISTIEVG